MPASSMRITSPGRSSRSAGTGPSGAPARSWACRSLTERGAACRGRGCAGSPQAPPGNPARSASGARRKRSTVPVEYRRSPAPAAAPPALARGELDPQSCPELILDSRVVGLAGADRHRVQHPQVQRPPLPVQALHLRRDRDVRMQVRVPRPGIGVVDRGRHETPGVDLRNPGGAGPRQRRVLLHIRERPPPGRLMSLLDLSADPLVAQSPQHRHGLDPG